MVDLSELPKYEQKKKYCRNCGAEIKFICNQKTQKNMPVDVKPIKIVTADGKVMQAYLPHWDTCQASVSPNYASLGNAFISSEDIHAAKAI